MTATAPVTPAPAKQPTVPKMSRSVLLAYAAMITLTVSAEFYDVPVYLHMISMVMLTIFIGCVGSATDLDWDPAATQRADQESMQTSDVYMFPVMGSITLFSLYCVFKLFPKEYVNMVLKGWFFVLGCLVCAQTLSKIIAALAPTTYGVAWSNVVLRIKAGDMFPSPNKKPAAAVKEEEKKQSQSGKKNLIVKPVVDAEGLEDVFEINSWDVVGLLFSGILGAWYLKTNHWAASNVFGVCFSIQGIESLLIGSYFNAAVLLSGLFFYDIFWVFGTDVMVTVARSFDAPIKLLFPTASGHPSMLGLGDIVIPGLFIALMMRFDVWLVVKGHVDKEKHNFKYFWNIMMWYFLGLTTTVLVMYHFKSAQPALLYLVPACLLGSFLPVALGGHLKLLWQYNDPGNEPEDDSKDKKD